MIGVSSCLTCPSYDKCDIGFMTPEERKFITIPKYCRWYYNE